MLLHVQAVNHVGIPFAKQTMWKKAIEKGTLDSCREVHEDLVRSWPCSLRELLQRQRRRHGRIMTRS